MALAILISKLNFLNRYVVEIKLFYYLDKWALSDVKFMTETVYMSTDQVITVDVTVHNLQRRTYIGGTAAFTLALCLYDEEIYGTGESNMLYHACLIHSRLRYLVKCVWVSVPMRENNQFKVPP